MSFAGITQFKQNLDKMMETSAFKNANQGEKLKMGGLLMRSKTGLGDFGGFGKVRPLKVTDN